MSEEQKSEEQKERDTQKPVNKRQRFFKLAGMTASVAGNYAKTRISNVFKSAEQAAKDQAEAHKASGERIAQTLGELKGAVMKVGQMASIAKDILPKELTDSLRTLQKEAPPMPYEVIAEQIKAELGAEPHEIFEDFDEEPFAAASIGQVHRALLQDGREVIVKIQYPGVDESCDSDLAHLKMAFRASGLVKVDKKQLNQVFEEIKERLHEELDYESEARHAAIFYEHYKDKPGVVVPQVITEHSSKRVLTLTYEPGDTLDKVKEPRYSQEIRDLIGVNFFRLVCDQIFVLKAVHGDPNPGNFAFRDDGTIVMYDFGCVKFLKQEIVTAYKNTIEAGLEERYDLVEEGLLALGVRKPGGPVPEPEYYKLFRDIFYEPFVQEEPFDYGTSEIHNEILKLVPGVLKRMASFQPPIELIYLDRMIAGHYGNLRRIECRGRYLEILLEYLALPQPLPESDETSSDAE